MDDKPVIIVSDSSPLMHLAAIHRLYLVPTLLGNVLIPPAVFNEITKKGAGKPGDLEIQRAAWIRVVACSNHGLLSRFSQELDAGEAEALALAIELNADAVLMDETLGRAVANRENVKTIGLLALLIDAKAAGLLTNVTQEMDALRASGFYIAQTLYAQIKARCNE